MEDFKGHLTQKKIQDEDEIFYESLISPLIGKLENGLRSIENEENYQEVFYYHVIYCSQKLFLVLKWPPWTKYNTNVISKEEWEEKVSKRKKALNIFFAKGGIGVVLRCLKVLDTFNKEGLIGYCLNLLICCAYAPDEQRYLIEKGFFFLFFSLTLSIRACLPPL